MTSVTSRAQQHSQGKLRLKRWVFSNTSENCGKQAVTVQTWCGVADCSKLERRQPEKLGRCTSTAAYGAQPETVTRPNEDDVESRCLPSGRGRRQGTTATHTWDTCKREGRVLRIKIFFKELCTNNRTLCLNQLLRPGCVKLFTKKVWFSYLLQQNVTWRLPEWSTLWRK